MTIRGIRGATTVESNSREEIITKTSEMLKAIMDRNHMRIEDVASAIFSVTGELNAEFPAAAAREIGWQHVPLFCTSEIPVKGSIKNCIRVLLHINTEKPQKDVIHVYLHKAQKLKTSLNTEY